jgi:hypothetical protein
VKRSIDIIGQGQPDDIVAQLAEEMKAVVVNSNAKDFDKLISRRPQNTGKQAFRFAGRISLRCKAHREAERLSKLMPRLLGEHGHCLAQPDARFIVNIHDDWFSVER